MQAVEEKRARRLNALRTALHEYAAGDFITRVVKGACARFLKRKLKLKASAMLRSVTSDSTGHGMRLIIKFQQRVRRWLASNQLFYSLYDEHRQYLLMQRSQIEYDALLTSLEDLEAERAERVAAVEASRVFVKDFCVAQMKYSKAQVRGVKG